MLRTLLQPRYAALAVLMVIVAAICTAAGVWQVVRLGEKIGANDVLRHNAHAAATPVADVVPLVGSSHRPSVDALKYRTVTATGTYLPEGQVLVRQRSVNSDTGYLVVTPLRTASGADLLVVRGFISGTSSTNSASPTIPPPPGGPVTIRARLEPSESRDDQFAQLHNGQVEAINAAQQATRLGSPTYAGYAELLSGEVGTSGLIEIPSPDLSNPAGGAIEPQHLAYVIQWFLFAALALAAPFVMARAETRQPPDREIGADDDDSAGEGTDADPIEVAAADRVAAKLGARYGTRRQR